MYDVGNDDSPDFDTAEFRRVFGHLPTGVVIITGRDATGEPLGITIGSFVSISLEPPLAGFFIGMSSRTWPRIATTGVFCANVLSGDQEELCWRFAKESDDVSRFQGVSLSSSANGSPVLPGVVAVVDCSVESTRRIGDHDLVVGAVTHVQSFEVPAASMVFYKGRLGQAQVPPK